MANVVRDGLWPCVCLERALAGRAVLCCSAAALCAIRTRRRRRRRSRRAHRALLKTWQRIRVRVEGKTDGRDGV